jgi:hypothetical protein
LSYSPLLPQDGYRDTQTLKKRLQSLAIAMGLRAQQQKQKTDEGNPTATACPGSDSMEDCDQTKGISANAVTLSDGPSGRLNTISGAGGTSVSTSVDKETAPKRDTIHIGL